jgi:hypothetical protein
VSFEHEHQPAEPQHPVARLRKVGLVSGGSHGDVVEAGACIARWSRHPDKVLASAAGRKLSD